MNDIIPSLFYKRAAQLMDVLPEIKFMDIVKVLYEHNRLSGMVEREEEMLNETEPPVDKIHRTYNGRKPYSRRERKHYCEAVVDGKEYTAKSKTILFAQLGIKDEYEKRQHTSVLPFINKSIVEIEYEFLKFTLEKYGSKLESYSAYDFDGQFKTIETKPEVANA